MQDVAERSAFLVDRRTSSAGHGGTRRASCPTSTSCSRPPLALVTLLYAAAAFVATWPAVGSLPSEFIANDGGGGGEPPAGDHLQSVYRFWLVGHQLEQGERLEDPYSFQPIVEPQTVLGGWPFGLPFWPLNAAFGPVVAWNILLFGAIVGAGLLTYGWLRALTLSQAPRPSAAWPSPSRRTGWSRAPAICWGGLRCSYRWPCSPSSARVTPGRRVHAWGALAAAATISIPLSGQLHLALGAVPFIVAYAAVRFGLLSFVWTLGGAAVAVGIGLAVRYTLIAGSAEEAGRSSGGAGATRRSRSISSIAGTNRGAGFVYLGWLLFGLAVAGLIVLARTRRSLAVLLGLALIVPLLFALGATLPDTRRSGGTSPRSISRVPERLLPLANLALAALAAFACAAIAARVGRRAAPVLAALAVFLALDLAVLPFSAAAADPDNGAYEALRRPHPAASSSCRSSARGSTTRASTTTSGFRSRASIPPATRQSPPRRRRRSTSTTPLVRRLASRRCSRPRGARDRSVALSPRPLRPGPPSRRLVCVGGAWKPGSSRRRRTAQ